MKKNLLLFIFCSGVIFASAQPNNYWTAINKPLVSEEQNLFKTEFKPSQYRLYQLKENLLRNNLPGTPLEKIAKISSSDFIISVPNAEGKIERFRIVEAPVMQPTLAAKYPNLKSYAGRGIDDPTATIRCDITPAGFHGMVTSSNNPTYYINPLNQKEGIYMVNPRDINDKSSFNCRLDDSFSSFQKTWKSTRHSGNADDGTLRKFRLALCVNPAYSQFFLTSEDKDTAVALGKVMASLVTNLTRANQVYERDFGIRMEYADNQDTLIFLDPTKDPWPKISGPKWNSETQKIIDSLIGKSNYDIGHLLGKVPTFDDNDGDAGCIACVCNSGSKGSGYTAYNDPSLTNYMVIDYWSHEMGHQFGANHTFTQSDERSGANVEPGSGSTIMGYAGIAGSADVQPHPDDYFHSVSIAQVTNYIKSPAAGCSVSQSSGNNTPVVDAGEYFIIPANTPFALTGTATDGDATDELSYTWEQIDIFENKTSNTMPSGSSTTGPLFRSIQYSSSQTRIFPDLETILEGKRSNKWEALPTVGRDMNFRFTARDNHPGGGNNKSDDLKVSVVDSGPFIITSTTENKKTIWKGGESQTITWDVANTNQPPVRCEKVNILLSVNGGVDFPLTLLAATDNDGEVEIIVPDLNTEKARIKIESVGNIFFDISSADFTIKYLLPLRWLSFTAKAKNDNVLLEWQVANETNNDHFSVQHSTDGIQFTEAGIVKSLRNSSQDQSYDFTDYNAAPGLNYYRLQQVDIDGRQSYSSIEKVLLPAYKNVWKIRPNPATENTYLKTSQKLSNVNIQLIDLSGKVVFSLQKSTVNAGERITIPVNQLTKGMYIIKLNSKEMNATDKLMVQ